MTGSTRAGLVINDTTRLRATASGSCTHSAPGEPNSTYLLAAPETSHVVTSAVAVPSPSLYSAARTRARRSGEHTLGGGGGGASLAHLSRTRARGRARPAHAAVPNRAKQPCNHIDGSAHELHAAARARARSHLAVKHKHSGENRPDDPTERNRGRARADAYGHVPCTRPVPRSPRECRPLLQHTTRTRCKVKHH